MAQHLRIADAEFRPRRPDEFALTQTARDVLRTLELMRAKSAPAQVMIAGVPGSGKTMALKHFCAQEGHDALYWAIAAGEGKPTGIATKLLAGFWKRANGMSLAAMGNMLAGYIGRGRVLVLDEAQYREPHGAEWVRALSEEAGFDLVLSGDLDLQTLVNRISPLRSRILSNRPVVINQVSRADVACMVEGTPFGTPVAIDVLHSIARLTGGLRNVENVTHHAQLFARSDQPGPEHLRAAIADMKLAPKGGK